jgi:OOP family OmpA-OmpF porin
MKKMAKSLGALGLVGCAVFNSQSVMAVESGWIGGLSVGQSKARIDDAAITDQLQTAGFGTTSINDVNLNTGVKFFGGYQFNRYFALEGGYFDLGRFGYQATTVPVGGLNGNIQLKGVNLDAVGMWPMSENFSLLGRLGANYAQSRDNFTTFGAVSVTDANPSNNSFNWKAGLGMQYDLFESVGLRGEWERYRINDSVGTRGDVDLVSIGLVVRLGQDKTAPAPILIIETPTQPNEANQPKVADAAAVLVIVPVKVKTQKYCSILDMQFEIKQNDIQREEKEKLSVVGTFMKKYPDTTALIEGHSDDVGTDEFNLKLSQQRAESVVNYLIDSYHIAPSRLTAIGYGKSRPIADNSTEEGRRANRRINAVIACATDIAGLKVAPARLTMAMEMEFDAMKDDIDPQYHDELAKIANVMKANPLITATVEGHAGRYSGSQHVTPEMAMQVSQRRAQNVVNYLVDKLDVPRARLSTAQFGSARRTSYGTTLEGRQENRRINIIFNYNSN